MRFLTSILILVCICKFINGQDFSYKVKVSLQDSITINGGPAFKDLYKLEEFHFHWKRNKGAEHAINGYRYDLEVHFVHRNVKYTDLDEAIQHPDGLMVIAIIGRLTNRQFKSHLDLLTDNFQRIKRPSKVMVTGNFNLSKLIPNSRNLSYWTYEGSLTTPLCHEVVTWVISDTVLPVTWNQLRKFEALLDETGKPISGNVRPLQPLNYRKVNYFKLGGSSWA